MRPLDGLVVMEDGTSFIPSYVDDQILEWKDAVLYEELFVVVDGSGMHFDSQILGLLLDQFLLPFLFELRVLSCVFLFLLLPFEFFFLFPFCLLLGLQLYPLLLCISLIELLASLFPLLSSLLHELDLFWSFR